MDLIRGAKGQVPTKVTFEVSLTIATGSAEISFVGEEEETTISSTISSPSTCMGPGEDPTLPDLLLLLLLTTEEAGEGGRHWEQVSSPTGVPALKLSRDSTAAEVLVSRTLWEGHNAMSVACTQLVGL